VSIQKQNFNRIDSMGSGESEEESEGSGESEEEPFRPIKKKIIKKAI
jgi:hypothetical protein